MFTTPCFIRKNTPELRGYLEGLGYKKIGESVSYIDYSFIVAVNGRFYETYWISPEHKTKLIDCGSNEELFKAISALRDDSDYLQWFTDGDKWEFCIEHKFSTNDINQCEGMCDLDLLLRHKATVEELIEKFK